MTDLPQACSEIPERRPFASQVSTRRGPRFLDVFNRHYPKFQDWPVTISSCGPLVAPATRCKALRETAQRAPKETWTCLHSTHLSRASRVCRLYAPSASVLKKRSPPVPGLGVCLLWLQAVETLYTRIGFSKLGGQQPRCCGRREISGR